MNKRFLAALMLFTLTLISVPGLTSETQEEREAKQAELNSICEAARQENLARPRAEYVEECIAKKQRPDCE